MVRKYDSLSYQGINVNGWPWVGYGSGIPIPTRKVYPWIPDYQYPLISIPESYPNILSMDINTLPETFFFFFLIQNILT